MVIVSFILKFSLLIMGSSPYKATLWLAPCQPLVGCMVQSVERRSLAGVLSLSCALSAADG